MSVDYQKKLSDTQKYLGQISSYLDDNFLIEGKTVRQWKREFYIKIPEQINFPALINLSAKIFTNYQKAAFYRDKQVAQLAILEQTKIDKYNDAYNHARQEGERKFKKPLAAESCRVAATVHVSDLENAIANQKVSKEFWSGCCKTLSELRKLIENIGYAMGADTRVDRDFVIKIDHKDNGPEA